jgi:hypothetical protein
MEWISHYKFPTNQHAHCAITKSQADSFSVYKHPMCSSLFQDQKPKHFHDMPFKDIFFVSFPIEVTHYVTIFPCLGHSSSTATAAFSFREINSYNALLTVEVRSYPFLDLAVCVLRIPKIRPHPIFWRRFSFFKSLIIPCSTLFIFLYYFSLFPLTSAEGLKMNT